ncbi:MAG: hypothetical protein A3H93_14475 [Rhodocyclales bacterium RIFCSPLOWO2_02_FULL_63_24]|nr:MAG: hypothetical protein A3H93_14475 [Rhodocyclales bacterium RIFCSPLOWO2_02_FULL_63_24]
MPLVLALVASALIHVAALVGPGWALPGSDETDPPPTIDAVLAKPPPRREAAPATRPKPPPSKPRPQPAASTLAAAAPTAAASVAAPGAAAEETPPAAVNPAATSPTAVSPAPTVEPAAAPMPARTALPGRGRLRYVITRGEGGFVIGQAVHSWEHDGFTYTLKSMTETTGLAALFKPAQVFQSSQGEVTAEGLQPREFRHERVGGIDTARFDWMRRVVAYAGREDSLAAGTQDMLSMYYQLVLLAPKEGALEMPIATGRKLESYRFEVLGEEVVALPAGERRAVHLKTRSGNDSIELWIELQMRGLPVKIRFTDRNGEIFDQIAQDMDTQEQQ